MDNIFVWKQICNYLSPTTLLRLKEVSKKLRTATQFHSKELIKNNKFVLLNLEQNKTNILQILPNLNNDHNQNIQMIKTLNWFSKDLLTIIPISWLKENISKLRLEESLYADLINHIDPKLIIHFSYQTEYLSTLVLTKNPSLIYWIQKRTIEHYKMTIKWKPSYIRYINDPTEEIYLYALSLQSSVFIYCSYMTEKMYHLVKSNYPKYELLYDFPFISSHSIHPKLLMDLLSFNLKEFKYIPQCHQNIEMCLYVVEKDPTLFKYCRIFSLELIYIAIDLDKNNLQYVPQEYSFL